MKNSYNKRISGRKGQIGQTVTLILILAGALVIYAFIARFTAKATFEEAINTCRFSVVAQSATELKPGITGKSSPLDINCEKRYIKFYNTKVELGLNPDHMKPMSTMANGQKLTKFRTLTEYTVNQVIAEEMRICKFEFADGKTKIFTNDEKAFSDQSVCFVCSEITFANTVTTPKFTTFLEYTQKTTLNDYDMTYFEYFTEKTIAENPMWLQPGYPSTNKYSDLTFDTSKSYAVFVQKHSEASYDIILKMILAGSVGGFYWEQATNKEILTIAIVPTADLNMYCDIQAS